MEWLGVYLIFALFLGFAHPEHLLVRRQREWIRLGAIMV